MNEILKAKKVTVEQFNRAEQMREVFGKLPINGLSPHGMQTEMESSDGEKTYMVRYSVKAEHLYCTCPDCMIRGVLPSRSNPVFKRYVCKHIAQVADCWFGFDHPEKIEFQKY